MSISPERLDDNVDSFVGRATVFRCPTRILEIRRCPVFHCTSYRLLATAYLGDAASVSAIAKGLIINKKHRVGNTLKTDAFKRAQIISRHALAELVLTVNVKIHYCHNSPRL